MIFKIWVRMKNELVLIGCYRWKKALKPSNFLIKVRKQRPREGQQLAEGGTASKMTSVVLIARNAERKTDELLSGTSALMRFQFNMTQANLHRGKGAPIEKMSP